MPVMSQVASAQAYPSRPVRLLVGFAPGGGTDVMARLLQPTLSERLGQQIVIENRPGAGTNVATEAVLNSAPDGYTLLAASLANAGNATLYDNLKFNFLRDFTAVAGITLDPFVLEVTPSLPVKTIPEFIAYAKAHPGKVNMGSGGIGSGNHLSGEMFKMMAGIDLVHVPYRGAGPAMVDLMGGQVQVMFNTMSASLQHVRAGTLRALGVATKTRQAALPDVPTVAEFVPGYEASFWSGIAAPKGAPARNRRQAEQGGQCGPGRSQRKGPPCRVGRHRACRLACRFRQVRRRRNREMGQNHPCGQHQGGVTSFDGTQIGTAVPARDGNFREQRTISASAKCDPRAGEIRGRNARIATYRPTCWNASSSAFSMGSAYAFAARLSPGP